MGEVGDDHGGDYEADHGVRHVPGVHRQCLSGHRRRVGPHYHPVDQQARGQCPAGIQHQQQRQNQVPILRDEVTAILGKPQRQVTFGVVVVEYDLSNGEKLVVEYKQVGFMLEVSSYRLEVGNDFS